MAAALERVLEVSPIVVGGTAETFWTRPEVYHETDLDLWVPALEEGDRRAIRSLGFHPTGRHWIANDLTVVVEFPGGSFAGNLAQAVTADIEGVAVRVISLDDLFFDRLEQATAKGIPSTEFDSVYALAVQRYDAIDWAKTRRRIEERRRSNPILGEALGKVESRLRRLLRQTQTSS